MKRIAVFLLCAVGLQAAGTVTSSLRRLAQSDTWVVTVTWEGDASDGTVPATAIARSSSDLYNTDGMKLVQVETIPGGTPPSANYDVALTDSNGRDVLGGQCANRSDTNPEVCYPPTTSPPMNGAYTFTLTGNSEVSATGTVLIYISQRTVGRTGGASGLGDAASLNVGTTAGTVAAGDDSRITGALQSSANLLDVASASLSRSNLGLGGAALLDVGTGASTVAAGNDSRITGAAQKASNLSDLASASTARTNLGLGGAALLAVGTTTGTVAAGDDSRITGAAQKSSNLSDLASASTARTNLGLVTIASSGSASDLSTGTVATARLGSGTASSSTFLRGDQTWATPSAASGDVVGPSSAVDQSLALYDGTTGKLLKAGGPTFSVSNGRLEWIDLAASTNYGLKIKPTGFDGFQIAFGGSVPAWVNTTASFIRVDSANNFILNAGGSASIYYGFDNTNTHRFYGTINLNADTSTTTNFLGNMVATSAGRTAPVKAGTSPPGTCTTGDMFIDTDASPSSCRLMVCTATNTWTAVGSGC